MLIEYLHNLQDEWYLWCGIFNTVHADLSIDQRAGGQAVIRGEMSFTNGYRFSFREYLDSYGKQIDKVSYSYHFQNQDDMLIFRYDNSPHKPALSQPEHRHSPEIIVETVPPQLSDLFLELLSYLE